MGKRIRHLEFYGFPDQNVFNGVTNIDLSDIRETNKNQDKEIDELSGETQNKADTSLVLELSGKVDTFIDNQVEIDEELFNSISGVTYKINEITDDVNEIESSLEIISGSISQHIDEFNSFKEETATELDKKMDNDVAENTYAKKVDVYSKEEADETFLKEHQDISSLATKEELTELKNEVDAIDVDSFATKEELNAVNEKVDSIDVESFVTKDEFEIFSGNVESYKNTTNEAISGINGSISSIESGISSIESEISALESGATTSKESIDELFGKVSNIEDGLSQKVDNESFISEVEHTDELIRDLNEKKADKTELSALSESFEEALNAESEKRISGDSMLSSQLSTVNENIDNVNTNISTINDRIDTLDNKLNQEIVDRKNGDIALIGTENDAISDDTIWGAKNYAYMQRTLAVSQANEYTNDKISGIDTLLTNTFDEFNTRLSAKADKNYVDDLVNERINSTSDEINNRINAEVEALQTKDENLESEIEEVRGLIGSGDTKNIYKRINVITTYSGDTPEEYIDSGNGILDVLHREFHQLEDEIGVIANPTLVKTNEYEAAFGRYNASYTSEDASGRTMFSVGIGTGNYDRKNAVEIRENGDVYMWVEGEFMAINGLLAMLAHETY